MESYLAKHKDTVVRAGSRSGGMFTAASDVILEAGGAVYGATLDEDLKVKHIRTTNKEQRDKLRGSKYVKSDFVSCINEAIEDLNNGKSVLFSGTGCQIAAVKIKCQKENVDTTNLFCIDIVCHGTPQAIVWNKYKDYLEKKYHGKLSNFNFRNKNKFGWKSHIETFEINGKTHVSREFTDLFYRHLLFAKGCFSCKYKSLDRQGDISLADAWGPLKDEYADNKGVSLVLVNSEKGKTMFEKCSSVLEYEKCNIEEFMQVPFTKNYDIPVEYDSFWEDVDKLSWPKLYRKYSNVSLVKRVARGFKYFIKNR